MLNYQPNRTLKSYSKRHLKFPLLYQEKKNHRLNLIKKEPYKSGIVVDDAVQNY